MGARRIEPPSDADEKSYLIGYDHGVHEAQTALRALLEQWETRKAQQKRLIQLSRGTPASHEAIGRFEEILFCVNELRDVLARLSPPEEPR